MNNDIEKRSAPYASYRGYNSFINGLRDTIVPNRIDRSVFGSMSGGQAYSIIAALKSLNLIDENGKPHDSLTRLVESEGHERKKVLQQVLNSAFPSLWDGSIDLASATSGQFDEHIRSRFGAKGSTVDKVASFLIAAAADAGISLSPHLKKRKPSAPSASSRKSQKGRKQKGDGGHDDKPPPPPKTEIAKPLEYQLVDLLKQPDIAEDESNAIWTIVRFLSSRTQKGNPDG